MSNKNWEYRIVRKESIDLGGSYEWYSIQEVYFDEDGKPTAQTIDLQIEADTITEMRKRLEAMIKCLDNPVLDEQDIIDFPDTDTDTETKTIEDRVFELGLENVEMRDRLTELGNIIERTKKVRSL
tara:strand:+ start:420 stop:797 length:378 start_codon:yes stop_codon:yes gene_type:complete